MVETTDPDTVLQQQGELAQAMREHVRDSNGQLDDVLFFVVDILNECAIYVSSSVSADRLVQKAWSLPVDTQSNLLVLKDVLSRKKQIIPALENAENNK